MAEQETSDPQRACRRDTGQMPRPKPEKFEVQVCGSKEGAGAAGGRMLAEKLCPQSCASQLLLHLPGTAEAFVSGAVKAARAMELGLLMNSGCPEVGHKALGRNVVVMGCSSPLPMSSFWNSPP